MSDLWRSLTWRLTLTLAISACGDGSEPVDRTLTTSGFSHYDSAGVAIAVTDGQVGRTPLGWTVPDTPGVVIGHEDKPGRFLHRVGGVTSLPDGRVVVVDGGSGEIRFFDPQGSALGSIGRKGEGPGEFQDPSLVPAYGLDSLLIYDGELRRFTFVSTDDQGVRVVRPEDRWISARPQIGAIGSRIFLDRNFTPSPREAGVLEGSVSYRWVDLVSGSQIVVASFEVPEWFVEVHPGYAPGAWAIPFTNPRPPAAVSPRGGLLHEGRAPEVREYDLDGRLTRIFRIDEPGRRVTPAMVEAMANYRAANGPTPRSEYVRVYEAMPMPDTLPAFSSLKVDEAGWVWAQRYVTKYEEDQRNPREWVVFDTDGQARGTVLTPAAVDIHEIGMDYILGVWTSELGVQQVHRYPLQREVPRP